MKYRIAVLLLLTNLGCGKNYLHKEASKPTHENKFDLGWISDSICKLDFPKEAYRPLRDNDLTCCIIECASQGRLECEEFIVNRITEHYNPDNKSEYMYCRNERRSAIVSRKIILSQYNYILNNPEIFTCQENFHGELHCSSERAVYDLMDGIQDLSRVKIDFNSLTHQFIKQAGPFDDVCDCKLSKAFFNAIKVQFESGQLDLFDFLFQTEEK